MMRKVADRTANKKGRKIVWCNTVIYERKDKFV
jgi:hypothetical protein